MKAPAGAEKDFLTNTAGGGGKREPRHKHAAGEKCFSSKADCKGVSSGSYRCISCKVRYVLKLIFLNNIIKKSLKLFNIRYILTTVLYA